MDDVAPRALMEVVDDELHIRPHKAQELVLASKKPITLVLAGNQSGKTSIGAIWMYDRIVEWDKRAQDPNEHLPNDICFWAVISSYPLLNEKLLPVFRDFFVRILKIGEYHIQAKTISVFIDREDGSRGEYEIHFKSAKDPDSLASATVAAMYVDECAMPVYTYNVWTELNARLTATRGRRLFTSTIYKGNYAYSWVKRKIYDRWKAGAEEIDVFRFESSDNPFASKSELATAKEILPPWEYDMRYRGIYTKPIGAVYNAFDEEKHVVEPFNIPMSTKRWGGIDPGVVNMAHVWIAEIMPFDEDYKRFPLADGINSIFVVYRTTLTGSTTTTVSNGEQARAVMEFTDFPFVSSWCGGAKSEKYFRADYEAAGIVVNEPPFTEVSAGISAVYALMKTNRFYVFSDQTGLLTDPDSRDDRSILSYSRKIDDEGNVLDDIEHKERYHLLDGIRYCVLGMSMERFSTATSFISTAGTSLLDAY